MPIKKAELQRGRTYRFSEEVQAPAIPMPESASLGRSSRIEETFASGQYLYTLDDRAFFVGIPVKGGEKHLFAPTASVLGILTFELDGHVDIPPDPPVSYPRRPAGRRTKATARS